jgi:hypothetical protein
MKKTAFTLNTLLMLGLLMATGARAAIAGPHLIMEPSSGTYTTGTTFTVTAKVDSGTENVGGADGFGTYDSSKLELVSAVKASGMVFEKDNSGGTCAISSDSAVGEFNFSCYANDGLSDTPVVGNLVTFTFKTKAEGTAMVKFTCTTGSTVDSNIVKTSDIIVCGENINGTYTINGTGSSTTTDDTTATPTTDTTTTTSELPRTGGVGATLGLVIFGAISFISVAFLKFL